MKKALIFGVCGFVGAHLTRELQNNGYEVYGSDVTPLPQTLIISKFLPADLLDAVQVKRIISDIAPDYIVNLAAISSVGQSWNIPQKTISVNVNGALNILEAVRGCGIDPDILLVGSSEEYANSDRPIDESCALNAKNPYGISKMMLEHFSALYRRSYGLKFTMFVHSTILEWGKAIVLCCRAFASRWLS